MSLSWYERDGFCPTNKYSTKGGKCLLKKEIKIVCIGNENTEALLNEQKGFLIALLNRILELKKNETNWEVDYDY